MKDFNSKFIRQIEILGIALNFPDKFKAAYFEALFNVNELTIKRDLRKLRSMGIDIHSTKGKGIRIHSNIQDEIVKNIIVQYTGLTVNQSSYDQATNLLVHKLHYKSIAAITLLKRCIKNHFKIKIKYEKHEENKTEERIVDPYCIFQSEKNWRLLANHESIIKQFLINRIKSIEQLDKKFKPITQKQIDEIFSTSFRSWLGNERYKIKLKFLPPWPGRIKPKLLMEFQKITENKDGSITYETIVNSLKEISSWIVSRGKGVIVLEPEELKQLVIKTAKETLNNYSLQITKTAENF